MEGYEIEELFEDEVEGEEHAYELEDPDYGRSRETIVGEALFNCLKAYRESPQFQKDLEYCRSLNSK